MPSWYPEGNSVLPGDGELRTLHKIASLIAEGGGGGGGGLPLVRRGSIPPVGDAPGEPGKDYTDVATGIHYSQKADGTWV